MKAYVIRLANGKIVGRFYSKIGPVKARITYSAKYNDSYNGAEILEIDTTNGIPVSRVIQGTEVTQQYIHSYKYNKPIFKKINIEDIAIVKQTMPPQEEDLSTI